jgi:thiol:disulfide interchange protein
MRAVAPHAEEPRESAAPAIRWERDLERAVARARRERRMLLVFVHADWSAGALAVDRTVWPDPRVRRALERMVALRLEVSDLGSRAEEVLLRLDAPGPPAVLLFDSQGTRLGRLHPSVDVDGLLAMVASVGKRSGSR